MYSRSMATFPYKHIIWDWNGTLLDDSWLSVAVINQVLAKREMPTIDHDHYISIFGFPVIEYYHRLGFDFKAESFEIIGTEFIDGYEAQKFELELHKAARKVLKALKERGVSHSILSAYKQTFFEELIDHFDLNDMFIKVIGLDNHYAHSKVDNGIQWMSELPFDRSEVLFVGDTEHDHEVAEALGIDCVLIPGGHQDRPKLEATGSVVVSGIEDLILKIEELKAYPNG